MLKKIALSLMTLAFATVTYAQNPSTPAEMPPALPNPNEEVHKSADGAIVQPKGKMAAKEIKKMDKKKKKKSDKQK